MADLGFTANQVNQVKAQAWMGLRWSVVLELLVFLILFCLFNFYDFFCLFKF